jgi:hypothetical protein
LINDHYFKESEETLLKLLFLMSCEVERFFKFGTEAEGRSIGEELNITFLAASELPGAGKKDGLYP